MRPRSDTLLVWTGAPCSYGCSFCPIEPHTAPAGVQPADLQRALAGTAGRLVVLVGGEPFLRPDFLRLIAAIRAAECVPGIVTTGRPLLYPHVRERLRKSGVAYVRVQLFGYGTTHDDATGVLGSFEQALGGLRAWLAESTPGSDVDAALNVRNRSFDALPAEIESLAAAVPDPRLQILAAIDGEARNDPRHADSLRRAAAALASWTSDAKRPLLIWEGLPPDGSASAPPTIAPLAPSFAATAPDACCLGPVDQLAAAADTGEVTRANSFNYVRAETSVALTATARECTAHAASSLDPVRHLWLVEGDRLVLHVTDTGDFDATEIERVKDTWSHLFVDRAAAGMLDDFTEGMRRVVPDGICDGCAHREACGRRFRLVEGAPFAREEAWIRAHVVGLRGRVLDVGCGEQLYRDALAPLLRSGAVQYTGLDPDEPSLAVARAALPEGRFVLGGIEGFEGTPESYDNILCLRSLNHVLSVDEALARMAALLKPGGQLLIVECTPFALLRRSEQVAAADRAPRAGHQHFRNVSSDEVIPFARRHALEVVNHQPASLPTTNQWILLLRRRAAGAA